MPVDQQILPSSRYGRNRLCHFSARLRISMARGGGRGGRQFDGRRWEALLNWADEKDTVPLSLDHPNSLHSPRNHPVHDIKRPCPKSVRTCNPQLSRPCFRKRLPAPPLASEVPLNAFGAVQSARRTFWGSVEGMVPWTIKNASKGILP